MDKLRGVFCRSSAPTNKTTAQDDVSKQGAEIALAQALCNPMSMLGMGFSAPPRSSTRHQYSASQATDSGTLTTESSKNSASTPVDVPTSHVPSPSLVISTTQARQTHQSHLQASGPRTLVGSRPTTLVLVSQPSPSVVPRTPSRNSYTEMVGLARSGGRSCE
jgi:hypothetical protein